MNKMLCYRKQFLLANGYIAQLKNWQHHKIDNLHLFSHPDIEITRKEKNSILIIMIGYMFDPFQPSKSNDDIMTDIISKVSSFNEMIRTLKFYTGRYAVIYKDNENFVILHDPLGLREIYFCTKPNKVICGSQPNLLNFFSDPKLGVTHDQNILHFYKHDMKLVRRGRLWIGDETYYDSIKHLMPNHYLDCISLTAKRYWPREKIKKLDFNTAVKQASDYLKGTLKAVTSRYDVMMAVTSGKDSRSLLAASREVQDRIYYFINKEQNLNDDSADICIPQDMLNKIKIPFHIHDVSGPVDEEFKKVFLNNVFMSSELILPTIYNVYYKNHQEKLNLLGVGEIGRDYYGKAPQDLDGYYLARCLKYKRSRYATNQCEKWLQETRVIAEKFNIDIMKLVLWELLLGNWGVVGNSESDIAIEEFDPYNSHYIYETMLSVNPAQSDIFDGMFKLMWPELLDYPFNPPETLKDRMKLWSKQTGIFNILQRYIYRYDHWRYRRLMGLSQRGTKDKGMV